MPYLDKSAPTIRYDYASLERLWIDAGGSSISAPIAAAIALAESSGYSNNFNDTDPFGGSRGLWQINGVHNTADGREWYDPRANAEQAVKLWKGRRENFTDWGSFTSSARPYLHFLHFNEPPADKANGQLVAPSTGGGTNAEQVAKAIDEAKKIAAFGVQNPFNMPQTIGGWDPFAGIRPAVDSWIFDATIVAIGLAIAAGGFAIASADNSDSSQSPKVIPVPI